MENKLGAMEMRFAELIWANSPIQSGELVRLCEKELNWKKATTYTVLRKFCDRGMFRNENGVVTVVVSREEFYAARSEEFVEETFGGSLPSFIAAFTQRKKLTPEEVSEIRNSVHINTVRIYRN